MFFFTTSNYKVYIAANIFLEKFCLDTLMLAVIPSARLSVQIQGVLRYIF